MTDVTLKGEEVEIHGGFLKAGNLAPDFILVNKELTTTTLEDFKDRIKIIATVPSLETPVCSMEAKKLSDLAKEHPHAVVIVVSKDLPFAQQRFCAAEGVENIVVLSDIRMNSNFPKDYGVQIGSSVLDGLLARAVFVLNQNDKVVYSELVSEITEEPNYEAAFKALAELEGY